MPTFKEFMRVAELTVKDKTSGKRAKEITRILNEHHAFKGLDPEKAVAILEDLGPTFVKIGQIMSNRSDLLPREYCDAFAELRAHVTPVPFDTILETIDASYNASWETVFAELDEKPLGSASIAQVHRGVLHDGTIVAVKVRRPGIVEQMAEDIMMMKHMIAVAEFATDKDGMIVTLESLVTELEKTTEQELDFSIELGNLQKFYANMQDQEGVSSPEPFSEQSTEDVLVMEFIEGTTLDSLDFSEEDEGEMTEYGERIAQSYVTQLIDDGFFHADPHPGNIVLRADCIVWVDLGMTGTLSTTERGLVGDVFTGVATNDSFALKQALVSLATAKGPIDHSLLLEQMDNMLNTYVTSDLSDIDLGAALMDIIDILRSNNLTLPPSFMMLARGLVTLEGVISAMAPSISIVDIVSQHVEKQMRSFDAIKQRIKTDVAAGVSSAEATMRIPKQISDTLEMLDRGQLKVNADLKMSDDVRATLYSVGGSLALAFISAGLFVGSSILCMTAMEPRWLGVPVLGFLGYCGAFILGVYVIWRTWTVRHKQKNNENDK